MDFSFSEELEMLSKVVKNFVDKKVDPRGQQIEEEDRIPDEIINESKEMGLFGLSIPAEYGGTGIGMVGKCLVFEQLGRTNNGFTTLLGAHNGIGSVGIVDLGTEAQKQKYLPDMASGEKIGAFALTEPNAGSDASNISTKAELKGDRYVLNGTKHFITNAPIAGVFTVMAVTDKAKGSKGITAFIVDMKVIKEAAMVKYYAAEAYCRVADKALQVFGGMGYMRELPIERYYRDARITRIYEGTAEIQKGIVAAQLLKEYAI
ncbi:acyl-CoA dehydrogenase family protein [Desulfosporosinus sp. BICA1-9]|uniref:acyl-CoA dehydrogenase family protein n=1 Tax=Desulfosporosinus sp. BICA1-9 TaxID=1531958 RepID=UPI00054B487E|nr:acyl-CoA dehydrogenase family protein [Desulfosporosinus sp. BICA1-9]KJS46745.1 MAG: hypothetical protein VR66_23690 [Peptococcaceae bacterium BRH_c23]KJS82360.1 MAG: hypothetical protein JL57_24500 [Desulfosporosinus sp. BICA1-9]HBW35799.1 acyl-CoA dehydrogenase [Desulfosporosinus sp.]